MALKLTFVAFLTTVLCFSSQSRVTLGNATQRSQPTKHGEVYRAKSLNEQKKDAENLARIAEEELALLKPIQHLLDQFVTGNASSGYQRCLTSPGGTIPMKIETKGSSLPQFYTISAPSMYELELTYNSLSSIII